MYPLNCKDKALLNKKYSALYKQRRIEFVDGLTLFVLPVFVIWRMYRRVRKDRAITDLRPFNRATIPNSYPLLLQQDIIESIRRKKYLTVVDTSNFFFQLFVHLDYKDRFIFINHRSLERSKMLLIDFKNSLLYIQYFIDRLLKDYREFCRAFIDDIVIFSNIYKEYV